MSHSHFLQSIVCQKLVEHLAQSIDEYEETPP